MACDCPEMDKGVVEVKNVEEWLNLCHHTLVLDGNNSSLLSILVKVGFYFKVSSVLLLEKYF